MQVRSAKIARSVVSAALAAALSGCAIVDQYGSRALVFNEEAASARGSAILLNVLRAAYRAPLQFTDLSTVTGIASASGTVTAAVPQSIGGRIFSAPNILTLTPQATMSGGPQFTIANLNTQEFYQGLQSSLEPQIIANYAAAGVPLKILLPLFVSEIEIDNRSDRKRYLLRNTAITEGAYNGFLTATNALVEAGLRFESFGSADAVGPSLSSELARDPEILGRLIQAASSSGGGTPLRLSEAAGGTYQLTKPGSKWRACFADVGSRPFPAAGVTVIDIAARPKPINRVAVRFAGREPYVFADVTDAARCGYKPLRGTGSASKFEITDNVRFTMRSLEGIFVYLGEIARTQLGIAGTEPADLGDPNGGRDRDFPIGDPRSGPENVFRIRPGSGGYIDANFGGNTYNIKLDPSGADASGQVVQIVTDLLALKSSAKALPAPNVISTVVQ